jgi:hypothetical protein
VIDTILSKKILEILIKRSLSENLWILNEILLISGSPEERFESFNTPA